MTAFSNKRVNPIDGSISWETMDDETQTVAELDELPGIYGFRLQSLPRTTALGGTMTFEHNTTGGTTWNQVTTAPLVGQVFVSAQTGLCLFNVADNGKVFIINYQGQGGVNSFENLESTVNTVVNAAIAAIGVPVERLPTYSNNVADATNDIDMTASRVFDKTITFKITRAEMTKRSDATWVVGSGNGWLDEGTIGDGSFHIYDILRSDTSVTDSLLSRCNDNSGTITMTVASPAVVTWTDHGLQAGSAVIFSTTGALPTGVTAGTRYYVIATDLTANTFKFSATIGGSAINTSGTQSGVHSAVSTPLMPTSYNYRTARLGSIVRSGSTILAFKHTGNFFRWSTPILNLNGVTQTANTPTTRIFTVPIGVPVRAAIRLLKNDATSGIMNCYPITASDGNPSFTASPLGVGSNSGAGEGNDFDVRTSRAGSVMTNSSATFTSSVYGTISEYLDDTRGV